MDAPEERTRTLPAQAQPGARQLKPGDRLADRFTIVRFIARGGMGEVYEAADEHLHGKHCALKILRPEFAAHPELRQRFEREVLLAREISHDNVCPTYDLFRDESSGGTLLFLTMKLLRGEPLSAFLKRVGRLDAAAALPLIRQMAAGLDAAHRAGVIHRDFKPGNVMVRSSGAEFRVSITDFGLSRLHESDSTLAQTGQVSGTAGYIAPEIYRGCKASPASDVYAFGVVLHEVLTGRKPVSKPGSTDFVEPSRVADGVPNNWDRVILGCLDYDPQRRFRSAGEALATVETGASEAAPGLKRRTLAVGGAAAAAAIALATWLGWPTLDAYLHPLPSQRFVAVMAWPPENSPRVQPVLKKVMDTVGNRLARAEALDKNLVVLSPGEMGQPAAKSPRDSVSSLGANLVLGVAMRADGSGYTAVLRVLEASTGKVLRQRHFSVPAAEVSRLADRASDAAAAILNAPEQPAHFKDEDEVAKLAPAAFQLFTEAEELQARANYTGLDEAIAKYQKTLEAEPRFALGYADLSLAYSKKFFQSQDRAFLNLASRNADLAVQYNPESARAMLASATVAMYSGDTQKALDLFSKSLQLDPGNPETLLYKALVFRDMSRAREEESAYREIIRERPNFWPAYNELGQCLYRQTRYRDAAEVFGEAAAIAPKVALPLANQGAMCLAMGDEKKAEDAFRRSLDRAPNEFAYSNLGTILFRRADYRGALAFYEKARDLNPKIHSRWRNIADCYAVLGDRKRELDNYAQAASLLSDALAINSRPGSSWATLAFYHAKLGRREQAEADLRTAEERGLDSRGQFVKAQALAVLGRKDDALLQVLKCIDQGLSPIDVELALDLKQVRADPRYRRHLAEKTKKAKGES